MNLAELEKEISNLLSCKDCPDNHGGYICDKEYNDRCLSQKIQYIKELKEEITTLEKENAELKEQNRNLLESCAGATMMYKQLIKAKEIIKDFLLWENSWHENTESKYALLKRAEDFIKGENGR